MAQAIASDDARTLSRNLDQDALKALQTAIEPIVDVRSVRFVGAVEKNGKVLAGYVMGGRDQSGMDLLVGFVLQVQGDQIVGVN